MTESANTPLKHFPVTWDELHRHARALAWRLLDLGPWRGIIAITRGGLVPAAIVARELDVRLVDTICVASYDDATLGAKPAGRPMVDTFVTEVSQDTWILFPWDIEHQFTPPLAAAKRKS